MIGAVCKKVVVAVIFCWLLAAGFEHYLMSCRNINIHQWLYPQLYSGIFDQAYFPIKKEKIAEFKEKSLLGYRTMKQSRVVICGLARDCAGALPAMMKRMEETGHLFQDYAIVVFENDSNDETRDILKEWAAKNLKVMLMDCEVPDCRFGSQLPYSQGACHENRMYKMAGFRNRYLDVVKNTYADFDYMMVIDMDLKGPWSLDGLATTFADCSWDGVFAYGLHTVPYLAGLVYGMYDAAAYVSVDGDYFVFSSYGKTFKNYMKLNFFTCFGIQPGDDFIQVWSAFGGMGIYRIKSLEGCQYAGPACEHAMLHKCMASHGHGRFYINPSLIVLSGHQGPPNPLQFLKRIINVSS